MRFQSVGTLSLECPFSKGAV